MEKDIVLNLEKLGNCKIAVALSGGRDSVTLAHALQSQGVQFFAVNVEHGIRGESSICDSLFVADFCKTYGIELKSFSVDVPSFAKEKGLTIEQGARELRYQVLDKLIASGECDFVALAHHSSDQVETVVMRILRGTGIKGLVGMSEIGEKYIRPLLDFSREDIDSYVAKYNLPYVDDETNADTIYTRNFLRQEIKLIKKRFPAFDESILRLSRNACEAEQYINSKVIEPTLCGEEVHVALSTLQEIAIAKRTIMKACNALGVYQDIEERHFTLILGLANCENGKRIELPHGIVLWKDKENLVFTLKKDNEASTEYNTETTECNTETTECNTETTECNLALDDCKDYDCRFALEKDKEKLFFSFEKNTEKWQVKLEKIDSITATKSGELFCDCDKIPQRATLRHRRVGDWIEKFGGGKKSLGDFLTDRKIPLRLRDNLVVLANAQEVLVVFGVEISEKLKVDENTKIIVKISLGK